MVTKQELTEVIEAKQALLKNIRELVSTLNTIQRLSGEPLGFTCILEGPTEVYVRIGEGNKPCFVYKREKDALEEWKYLDISNKLTIPSLLELASKCLHLLDTYKKGTLFCVKEASKMSELILEKLTS